MVEMDQLRLSFHLTEMGETEAALFWQTFYADLGGAPDWVLERGIDEYRNNPENRFFPRACHLLAPTSKSVGELRTKLAQIEEVLRLPTRKEPDA